MPVKTVLKLRNGTAAQWTSTNPTLVKGELGIETDTNKFKFGDGTTAWTSLPYVVTSSGTTTVDWVDVLNKPATFTPSSHTHAQADVTNLTTDLAAKAPLVSPSFTTPSLGVATATSINGTTIPSTSTLVTTAAGTATAATTAVTATNIAGGIASQIPYQTGAGATSFIANGTAGQVLTSNGTSAPAFATPAAGGGMTLISSVTTALGATSTTLSSIPQTYKSLKLVIWYTGTMTNPTGNNLTFNGVTANNHYSLSTFSTAMGSSSGPVTLSGTAGFSQAAIFLPPLTTNSPLMVNIENYTSATLSKTVSYFAFFQYMSSGMYYGAGTNGIPGGASQAAVTSIGLTFSPGASAAANIQLWGIN